MSSSHAETAPNSPSSTNVDGRRSYVLELTGAVSVVGFFVGIFFAYQTQVAGVVTQNEFDQVGPGQSLAAVNELLGFEGTLVSPEADEIAENSPTASSPATTIYVWENSSVSYVRCEFVDDHLTNKTSVDLP